ncbi:MAG: hypothetical protein JO214_11375 [Frankiaceae bacterium]|nr:hypothetical protein [Frankiaceae bacterium]
MSLSVVRRLAAGVGSLALLASGVLADRSTAAPVRQHHRHPVAHNTCHRNQIAVPRCGVLWGMFRMSTPDTPYWKPHLGKFERAGHRRFDIVKNYTDWAPGDTFPNPAFTHLGNHHRLVYMSWNLINYKTHQRPSYASVIRGAWDKSVIRPEARRLKHYHHRIVVDIDHEFDSEAQAGKGTPEQYAAMYRHVVRVMRRAGVHNVIWSWVSTGYLGNEAKIRRGYPGRRFVDWIGYDPYNFAQCQHAPWRGPAATFRPFYRWTAHQRGMRHKPLILAEYGSAQGPKVGRWYAGVGPTLRQLPRIKAALQFSATSSGPKCTLTLGASRAALDGFSRSGRSSYVLGRSAGVRR